MEKFFSKIQPKHYGIVSAVLSAIGMFVILYLCGFAGGGKYVVIYCDYMDQYIPYIKMFFRNIIEGESIWYSWSSSLGMNTSLLNLYYVMSPFNILYLLFWNVDENIITVFIIVLKIALSAYTFQLFSKKVLNCEGIESICFSIAYALSTYVVLYGYLYNSWMEGIYMLPLICVLVYELDGLKSYLKLIIAYAYIFATQFYFAYMVGIFSFVFWIIIFFFKRNQTIKLILKSAFKYAMSVIVAVGLVAIVLLPAVLFLVNDYAGSGLISNADFSTRLYHLFYALFWGNKIYFANIYPAIYCGWPVLLMVPLFFVDRNVSTKEKIISGIVIGLIALTMLIKPLYLFMHAFDEPNALHFRFAFLLVFVLCGIACRYAKNLKNVQWKKAAVVMSIHFIMYLLLERFADQNTEHVGIRMVVNALVGLLWVGIIYLYQSNRFRKIELAIAIVGLFAVELCANGWYVNYHFDAQTKEAYECWRQGMADNMAVLEEDESFYRTYYNLDLSHNSDAWFGYNGIADFCSVNNDDVNKTLGNLGLMTDALKVFNCGITPPVETILSVKYSLEGPIPQYQYDDNNCCIVTENPYFLSLGYMVEGYVKDYQFEGYNDFEHINSLMRTMSGKESLCFEPFEGTLMAECYQADLSAQDDYLVISYDPMEYDYGMITYYIPADEVTRPVYSEVIWETDSVGLQGAPYLLYGIENIIKQTALVSTPYIKPMLMGNGRYELSILMNESTLDKWIYKDIVFYEYNEEALVEIYDELSKEQLEINEYENGYVKGTIQVSGTKDILFTTIPYDEGWTVMVDGEQVDAFAVLDNTFLAIELEEGFHDIEFVYHVPGLKEGTIVSCVSICCFACLLAYCILAKRRKSGLLKED